ncbi:Phosphoglycerate mutase [Planctomycetales bacterium 10988]|nr:Phosphoglycerate mutase [Planctomycetales bacterium 10988]
MHLYCVRHGESEYNADHRIQGQLNPSLSELGRLQGKAVAEVFQTVEIEAIFTSPLKRAAETARFVAEMVPSAEFIEIEDLQELNAGIFQGLRWDEIAERYPEEAKRWKAQEPDFVIPQGESRRQLMDRGRKAMETIYENYSQFQKAAVIAHGGILTAAFKSLLQIPAEINPFALQNCSISQLARTEERIRLISLNQVWHLDQVNSGRRVGSGDL